MSSLRTVVSSLSMLVILGVGAGAWALIAPGEEDRKKLLKNVPASNPVILEETRRSNALVMQALKEASRTNDNIARGISGPVK